MTVAEDVRAYLADAGIVDGQTGWRSQLRAITDKAGNKVIVLTEDVGQAPEPALSDASFRRPGFQVFVRGDPWESNEAQAKAEEVFVALHGLSGEILGSTPYTGLHAQNEPAFIGFDGNGRPQYTVNFIATVDSAVA